jgi:intermembrane space import and assembly protein 40
LEEEAGQQGAFNPETGEINWDCPCLGGMAHGPCGEEFKAAFSCFVYSTEEPKGMECIDKFQYVCTLRHKSDAKVLTLYRHMQDCFRQYPDIYGAELQDDEEEGEAPEAAPAANPAVNNEDVPAPSKGVQKVDTPAPEATDNQKPGTPTADSRKPVYEEKLGDSDVIPKKAVDATDANAGKQ